MARNSPIGWSVGSRLVSGYVRASCDSRRGSNGGGGRRSRVMRGRIESREVCTGGMLRRRCGSSSDR